MKCKSCGSENPQRTTFCRRCGNPLAGSCLQCGSPTLLDDRFCGSCGTDLTTHRVAEEAPKRTDAERKQVTILFSDLSGYTAISETLDPEEVKEIMTSIFGDAARVVAKYEGHIEKFIGDAIMVLFGLPTVHEDDPIRAIKAAREIHQNVEQMSPQLEGQIGRKLAMHSGITTGLVVTEHIRDQGIGRVLGDAINLASRLTDLAPPGQILVGESTFSQAERYFDFEPLEPVLVKGRAGPVTSYGVLGVRERPVSVHRLSGLSSRLVGRETELALLVEAAGRLKEGSPRIVSVRGDAGTGKSRLVREFRDTLASDEIEWREAHCYPYCQNIPYFPLIDLFSHAWQMQEDDLPQQVREKVESNISRLLPNAESVTPYIGGLFGLDYPEVEGLDPESWRHGLVDAIKAIVGALTQTGPAVIWLEDLHWADPSSLEILRSLLPEFKFPVLFLCVYRPPFTLFGASEVASIGEAYREIQVRDLSPSEAQAMMESLLQSREIPADLRHFVQDKVEGNPFYLEEIVNSLVESETLTQGQAGWTLTRALSDIDLPLTINGVISARLDRLERQMKRVLQEASVIGRAFLYNILKMITDLEDELDHYLNGLQRLDLIRTRSLEPELEYVFKHALTQEVAYRGLLKQERQEIHERIGVVMEQVFRDRLPEVYETLAFHFKQGRSTDKAITYLVKSGEKSLRRYAVEESHQYFKEAFALLSAVRESATKAQALIELLNSWSPVFFYRGDFKAMEEVLRGHQTVAEAINDKERRGMFYVWLGAALWGREELTESRSYLLKALDLGEQTGDDRLVGYSCAWLAYTCGELGLLEEALSFGQRSREIASRIEADQDLYVLALGGLGWAMWVAGDRRGTAEVGSALLDFGNRKSNTRSLVYGHFVSGHSYFIDGDMPAATECYEAGRRVSADPWLSQFPRLVLALSHVYDSRFEEAATPLEEIYDFSLRYGSEIMGTAARGLLGAVEVARGQMTHGVQVIDEVRRHWLEKQCRWRYINSELILGNIFLRIVQRKSHFPLLTLAKNAGFIARNVPFASRRAEEHLLSAREAARSVGASAMLGQACLDLGSLYKYTGQSEKAAASLTEASELFEQCEADHNLERARAELRALGSR